MPQQWSISWSGYDEKWTLYDRQLVMISSVAGLRKDSKALPEAKVAPKKVMITGGLLPVWSTIAFWILAKPLHLRSLLSKSVRCTGNFNACSRHWLTKRTQFFSMTTPDLRSHNKCFKVEWIGLQTFATLTWPQPTNCQFKHLDNFYRENTSTTSSRQRLLSKSS